MKPVGISGIKREYLKDKINELGKNSKNKNIRDLYKGINSFKGGGYQPRSNLVKNESCDLFADSHHILNRWKNYLPHLLNVHMVSDVRLEIHTAEPLVPDPSTFEVEIPIVKLKRGKSPGSDQILAE
jgi:hypothetical protein